MKKAKRFLTMFLVCIMAFGIVPISATNVYASTNSNIPTQPLPIRGGETRADWNGTTVEIYLSNRITGHFRTMANGIDRGYGMYSNLTNPFTLAQGVRNSIIAIGDADLLGIAGKAALVSFIVSGGSNALRRIADADNGNGVIIPIDARGRPRGGIRSQLIRPPVTNYRIINRDGARMRAEPHSSFQELHRLPYGTVVIVVGGRINRAHYLWWVLDNGHWIYSGNAEAITRDMTVTTPTQPAPSTPAQPSTPQQPSAPSTPSQPQLTVIDTLDGNWHITIPPNFTVNLFNSATATTRTTVYNPGRTPSINANRQITFSNGATRYRFEVQGRQLYFDLVDGMHVENRGIPPALAPPPPPRITEATIVFNSNGGNPTPAPIVVRVRENTQWVTVNPPMNISRQGHHLLGWTIGNNPNAPFVGASTAISVLEHGSEIILYAQWEVGSLGRTVQVHYDASGGIGAPASHTATIDNSGRLSFQVPLAIPSRSGYLFYGWLSNLNNQLTMPNRTVEAFFASPPNDNFAITFTAHWVAYEWFIQHNYTPPHGQQVPSQSVNANRTVTIRYNANGGIGAPASHTASIAPDGLAVFSLATTRPTRAGHTFLGWRLENDRALDIDDPNQQIAIELDTNGNVTLTYFAQWQSNTRFAVRNSSASVTVRNNHYHSAGTIINLPQGTAVTVANHTINSRGERWYRVMRSANNWLERDGWIYSGNLSDTRP